MGHSVRMFEVFYMLFFAALAGFACGGVYVYTVNVYMGAGNIHAYPTENMRMRGVNARLDSVCKGVDYDSLQRGDFKRLHSREASKSDVTSVYDTLKSELQLDNEFGRIPADIYFEQLASITVAYTRIATRLQTRRNMLSCLERCALERVRGDHHASPFYRKYCTV